VVSATNKVVVHSKEIEVKAVDFIHHDARLTATGACFMSSLAALNRHTSNARAAHRTVHCVVDCWTRPDISLDAKADTATFTFERDLPLGKAKLAVTFVGQLNDQMAGFYRTKYAARDGSQKYDSRSQCVACVCVWDDMRCSSSRHDVQVGRLHAV
jgi:aminopeptidase N